MHPSNIPLRNALFTVENKRKRSNEYLMNEFTLHKHSKENTYESLRKNPPKRRKGSIIGTANAVATWTVGEIVETK